MCPESCLKLNEGRGVPKCHKKCLKSCLVREAPTEIARLLFGHCPFGGGGLKACQDGLGHLFREELSKFKWAICLIEGGSKCLPGWFGALMQ